jgi:hypothetical protein
VHAYTANYCEENVWHLADAPGLYAGERWAVIVAALGPAVPVWSQRAAEAPGLPVLWDYHVFLAVTGEARWIYDLDTTLPFPSPLDDYLHETFGPGAEAPAELLPHFRVVPAAEYRAGFWSDRGHMRDPAGAWLSPPPAWPAILPDAPTLPLLRALDMRDRTLPGQLLDLAGLHALGRARH